MGNEARDTGGAKTRAGISLSTQRGVGSTMRMILPMLEENR